jgi:hypothetical protein
MDGRGAARLISRRHQSRRHHVAVSAEPGKPIRWGVVGLGKFAGEALLPAAGRSEP